MPVYYPENNFPLPGDEESRSLHKINDLLFRGLKLDTTESGLPSDSFGRLRISSPFTLFDSSHRFQDNGLWATSTSTGGAAVFDSTAGAVDLNVTSSTNSSVLRETLKVFSYQPGKSLLVLNTFVLSPAQTGLRQRVGYFGTSNGYYLELNNSTLSFVERSLEHGTSSVSKSDWNVDRLDGSGPSGFTLDPTKAQILWFDFEWLGVGTVRAGFVINGQFVTCHKFHHANLLASTYITTASLPLRYEITNVSGAASSATLTQICSSVISEGGYTLTGSPKVVQTAIGSPYSLANSATYYPIVSVRLKSTKRDAVVIPTGLSFLPADTGHFNWKIVSGGTTSNGTWVDLGSDSAVEYNITGSSLSGGTTLAAGFLSQSNQSSPNLSLSKDALFKFQLERNSFTPASIETTLLVAAKTVGGGGTPVFGSLDLEEVTR